MNKIKVPLTLSRNECATISTGVYNTSSYKSKEYTSNSALIKGLKSKGFDCSEVYHGCTWNYGGQSYKVTFF